MEARLLEARAHFLRSEHDLLTRNVSEVALTATFANYLRPLFPDWNVDPEYNRLGAGVKYLRWRNEKVVRPDIVVHHRGCKSNLLVIEAKKEGEADDDDRQKLAAFKADPRYEYRHAVFVRFVTGPEPDIRIDFC